MLYSYRARSLDQTLVEGTVEGASVDAAADLLIGRGLSIISLTEFQVPFWKRTIQPLQHVRVRDLVVFFRQLSVLISASVPIVQALRILVNQITSPTLRKAVGELADEVDGGSKLSAAMARYPHIFSPLHRSLIQTGETSGKLDEVMEYLAAQEERNYDLMSKIKGSMTYPIVTICMLVGVGTFVMVVIIPQLTAIIQESGAELPLATRILIGISYVISNWWWAILLGIGVVIAGGVAVLQTPYGRWQVDAMLLKLPIFGKLLQRIYLVRICRALQTLIIGGVHVTRALAIVSGVVGNVLYKQIIEATVKEVEDGNSITTVMARSRFVPPMVPQMLAIGEQTGKLDEILEKIADFYSREIDNLVRSLVSLIEPLIIIVIALGVATLLVAVLLPLYNITAAAGA